MGRMKEVFMEVMQKYGKIPPDYTLQQYFYEKEQREKRATEAQGEKDSRKIQENSDSGEKKESPPF